MITFRLMMLDISQEQIDQKGYSEKKLNWLASNQNIFNRYDAFVFPSI